MTRFFQLIFLGMFTAVSFFFFGLICQHSGIYGEFGILIFLNGPVREFSLVEIMWWLFLFAPVWAGSGWLIDMDVKCAGIALYRYHSACRWWLGKVLRIYGLNIWYFIGLMILSLVYNDNLSASDMVFQLMTLSFHSLAMAALMIWFSVLWRQSAVSFLILVLLECMGKTGIMMGIPSAIFPFSWGMLGYSNRISAGNGFSWMGAILMETIFIALTALIPCCCRRLIIRSVHI